jgi:hypothetical protein
MHRSNQKSHNKRGAYRLFVVLVLVLIYSILDYQVLETLVLVGYIEIEIEIYKKNTHTNNVTYKQKLIFEKLKN